MPVLILMGDSRSSTYSVIYDYKFLMWIHWATQLGDENDICRSFLCKQGQLEELCGHCVLQEGMHLWSPTPRPGAHKHECGRPEKSKLISQFHVLQPCMLHANLGLCAECPKNTRLSVHIHLQFHQPYHHMSHVQGFSASISLSPPWIDCSLPRHDNYLCLHFLWSGIEAL